MKTFALVALTVLGLANPGVGNCGPLLNEFMADPATDWDQDGTYSFKYDEWVEIVNPDGTAIDLNNYYLGDETGAFVYGFGGMLPPHAVFVVYGSESVSWEQTHGESTTGLRLGNDGDTITLWHMVGGNAELVDTYTYTTFEAEDDRSSGRMPDGAGTWKIFDSLNPYAGSNPPLGTGLAPTPGASNGGGGGGPTPVQASTWGRVKHLYETQ